jgi:hypothetical protein
MSNDEIEKKRYLIQLKEWGSNMIKLTNNTLFLIFLQR